jgi:serine/threonine-protein kinase
MSKTHAARTLTIWNGKSPESLLGRDHLHFRFEAIVGSGAMGVVYKAFDNNLGGRVVAIKIPFDGFSHRFLNEAVTPAAMVHPQIATVFEASGPGDVPFIAMQFVEGASLGSMMSNGSISASTATQHILDVVPPLEHAHLLGVIHRDIKPENVIVPKFGKPFITDFGLAKTMGRSGGSIPGTVLGTPAYMSPEQAQGHHDRIGPWSDLLAVGAMLYEAQCGALPFDDDGLRDPYAILARLRQRKPATPLSNYCIGIDPAFEAIIMKCLETDPKDRYQSCEELAHDLKQFKHPPHL